VVVKAPDAVLIYGTAQVRDFNQKKQPHICMQASLAAHIIFEAISHQRNHPPAAAAMRKSISHFAICARALYTLIKFIFGRSSSIAVGVNQSRSY
jgi:hypothetical protein